MPSLGQSRVHTFIEVLLNIGSGMFLAFTISQLADWLAPEIRAYIYSDFVWEVTASSNLIMTTVLTVVSMGRSYLWRRLFNKLHENQILSKLGGDTDDQKV